MKHFAVFAFVILASKIANIIATFSCYNCRNCQLPIADGTSLSEQSNCQNCKIEFTLGQSGGPTRVNATCDTSGVCQASYVANTDSATVVSCCATEKCNSIPGSSARFFPNYLAILIAFLVSL